MQETRGGPGPQGHRWKQEALAAFVLGPELRSLGWVQMSEWGRGGRQGQWAAELYQPDSIYFFL